MLIKPSWHSWTKVVTGLDLVSLCSLWFKVISAIHHDPAKAIGNKGTDTFLSHFVSMSNRKNKSKTNAPQKCKEDSNLRFKKDC